MSRFFSHSLLALALLGFYTASLPAVEAIPESCLRCKGITDDGEFITCLYDCLSSVNLENFELEKGDDVAEHRPAGSNTDSRSDGPDIDNWRTTEIHVPETDEYRRFAVTESTEAFPVFFDRVKPSLVLLRNGRNDTVAVIDVRPASVAGFGENVLVQVDDEKIRRYPVQRVWSGHAVLIKDKALIESIGKGRILAVRLDTFESGIQTVSFDLKGSKTVLDWLGELDSTRS